MLYLIQNATFQKSCFLYNCLLNCILNCLFGLPIGLSIGLPSGPGPAPAGPGGGAKGPGPDRLGFRPFRPGLGGWGRGGVHFQKVPYLIVFNLKSQSHI